MLFSRSGRRCRRRGCNCKTNTKSEMGTSVAATSEKVSNHIPNDVAFSILLKLPLKSLKRFECVRKSWSLLFEDPYFMNIYRSNFISRSSDSYYDDTSILLQEYVCSGGILDDEIHSTLYLLSGERFENKDKLDVALPLQDFQNDFVIILGSGSINGILCLTHRNGVVLWNPVTKDFKTIPPSSIESLPDQNVDFLYHGFGYDYVTNDYKVIRCVDYYQLVYSDYYPKDNYVQVICHKPIWEIYSLRSNSWRKLDVDMPISPDQSARAGLVYMDGMCHWWGISQPHIDVPDSVESYLVSFDLSNEVFFTTLMPLDMDDNFDFTVLRYLVVLNGSMALISYHDETTIFHISVLGEIGVKESWIKLLIVGPLSCVKHPIGAGKKGDIFFVNKDGELVWFDVSTQMIEKLGVKGNICDRVVAYEKSFLPMGG